jgi:hypothetical protein
MADGRTCTIKVPDAVAKGSIESRFRVADLGSAAEAARTWLRKIRRGTRFLQGILGLFLLSLPLQAQGGAGFQHIYDSDGQQSRLGLNKPHGYLLGSVPRFRLSIRTWLSLS